MHHPWRRFSELSDWTLRWTRDLPSHRLGLTHWGSKTVWLAEGMSQAQRRCTIAHETQHIVRGPVPTGDYGREEKIIDRHVSRLLIPRVGTLGHVLAWARDVDEAAYDLWVDRDTLMARLHGLHPAERAYLKRRLAEHDGICAPREAKLD